MGLQQHSFVSRVFPAPQVRLGQWTVSRFDIWDEALPIRFGGSEVGAGVIPDDLGISIAPIGMNFTSLEIFRGLYLLKIWIESWELS